MAVRSLTSKFDSNVSTQYKNMLRKYVALNRQIGTNKKKKKNNTSSSFYIIFNKIYIFDFTIWLF